MLIKKKWNKVVLINIGDKYYIHYSYKTRYEK